MKTLIKKNPYDSYRARVANERAEKNLKKGDITIEEANWKLSEIDERYDLIDIEAEELRPCITRHYNDARSVYGSICKAGRVTKGQWSRLIKVSWMLYEASRLNGLHYHNSI